jgi:hypothetical protein
MCNDQTSRGDSIRVIDQIVTQLAGVPDPDAEKAQK